MKKISILLIIVLVLVGCQGTDDGENLQDGTELVDTLDNPQDQVIDDSQTIESDDLVMTYPEYPEDLNNIFGGEWTSPGLVNADGSVYISPEPNETTGQRINVADYGAVADDETVDNSISFQLAMDAAVPGDEVYVPAGNYYFNEAALFSNNYVAHIVLKSGVNFVGDGMNETVLISNFDANTNEKYKTAVVLVIQESDIVISDMTITSNTDDSRLPDPDVSNLNTFVETAPVYGIVIDNDKPLETHGNVVVDHVMVEKFQRMGIRIRVVRDIRVSNCLVQKATDLGGGGAGYGISIQGMTNNVDLTDSNLDPIYNIVENCTVYGPYMRHGILLQYSAHNNLVINNTVQDTLLDAIDLHGEDEYANEIAFNTVINTRRGAAIGLGNSGATHDATGPNNYIHDNEIIGGDRGIDILFGTAGTVVNNNTISDIENVDGTGIFIQNGHDSIIMNNIISGMSGEEAYGLKILYSYNALAPEVGIPDGFIIQGNTFENLSHGYYIETHTDNYVNVDNQYLACINHGEMDDSASFLLPPISDVVIPRVGDILYATDDNFITNEAPSVVQSQSNMKFKSSYFDVPYNRMIYMKFDLSELSSSKENVYLKFSGKSKDGLVTINIYGSTEYTDWRENSITWENALYHENQVAKSLDPDGELTHVTDFTFTTVGSEFNTYYVDVTDYIKSVDSNYVTLILVNDEVQDMYCEIYSKETSSDDYKPCLLWSND